MQHERNVAEVVVLAKPDRVFHYEIPDSLRAAVVPGVRVRVSFGRRTLTGYVVGTTDRTEVDELKPIAEVLDPEPILSRSILALTRWMADYYLAPWGKVLAAAAPIGSKITAGKRVVATAAGRDIDLDTVRGVGCRRMLEVLRAYHRPVTLARLSREGSSMSSLPALIASGWVQEAGDPDGPSPRVQAYVELNAAPPPVSSRAPRQSAVVAALITRGGRAFVSDLGPGAAAVCRALAARGVVTISLRTLTRDPYLKTPPSTSRHALTPSQRTACSEIVTALDTSRFVPFLLWGVTGSGKTEVYLQMIEAALARGRRCLVLVPEIALTSQIVHQVRGRFADRVAVLHSGLSDGERFDAWCRLRSGKAVIALGTRSALFAPLEKLGLIVVDEEQDGSYKQEDGVRYHARDSAVVLARATGSVVLLGSATPSLESYANALEGRYRLLTLPERVESRPLPVVRLIDRRGGRDPGALFSPPLREAIEERLARKEQVVLLLNRRGYAPIVLCEDCGTAARCTQCCVGLTYHRGLGRLCCHYCGATVRPSERCETCGGHRITWRGVGTEQVEEYLRAEWPRARVARMDRDTTRTRLAHDTLLDAMRRGEADILVGTQMVAKGHDLPNVTLVGIVNADVGLSLPDFRATERVFQLLAQAAGRAGRGERPGEVIIQTRHPSHDAFVFAERHDVAGFYDRELATRRALGYPPFGRLVLLLVTGGDEGRVIRAARQVADAAAPNLPARVVLLGPAPAPFWRLKGRHRWQVIIKGPRGGAVRRVVHETLARVAANRGLPSGVTLDVNVDPYQVV